MLETANIVPFIPSRDLDRSERFFRDVMGLTLLSRSPYACVFRTGQASLRVTRVDGFEPQPFTIVGWVVADLRAEAALLREAGVTFLRYDGMQQGDDDVWTTPSRDLIAWFHDPDGNVLSLTELATASGRAEP